MVRYFLMSTSHTSRDPSLQGTLKKSRLPKQALWKNGADNTKLKAILSVSQCEGLHLLGVIIMQSFGPCIMNLVNTN